MLTAEKIDQHNCAQQRYFEERVPRTMIPSRTPYITNHIEHALAAARLQVGERVLEAGCGMGRFTLPLWEMGVEVEAQDLLAVLLERLEAYNRRGFPIALHCGDLQAPDPGLIGCYDLLLGFFMLHHLADLEAGFKGMAAMLKPGGRMVFVEPNPFNPFYYVQMAINPGMTFRGDKGIVNMRRAVLQQACAAAGLTKFRLERYGFSPPLLRNRPAGAALDAMLEKIPVLAPFRAFQVVVCCKDEGASW